MNWRLVLRRYCLAGYWAACAVFTLHQGQYPGWMLHPEQWRYPWGAVSVVLLLLAVLVAGLHLILRPATYHRSWGRLLWGLGYTAVLVALTFLTVVTDQPGYWYVPAQFAFVTFAGVLAFALVQVGASLWRRLGHDRSGT